MTLEFHCDACGKIVNGDEVTPVDYGKEPWPPRWQRYYDKHRQHHDACNNPKCHRVIQKRIEQINWDA